MALRSRYRDKNNIPAEEPANIPDEPIQPSETTHIEFTNGAEPADVTVADIEPAPDPSDASAALIRQLEHLRASEQAQRQYAAQMAAPAPTLPAGRDDRLALWRQVGLSDDDASFLQARPDMIDNPQITQAAYAATLQAGIERNSSDFAAAMEGNFASLLNRGQAQAQPAAPDPAGFFAPRPAAAPSRPDTSHIVSAPVSRRETGGGYREPSLSSVRLSPAEQEMARAAGISDATYAAGKLRMLRERASGQRE
jgi:hypothetical protein